MFFPIIRNALWGTPISLPGNSTTNWDSLVEAYKRHAMLGLVVNTLATIDNGAFAQQQPRLYALTLQYTASLMQTHHKIGRVTEELFAELRNAGLHPILLKGDVYSRLYPKHCIRSCGDIDIFVGHDEYNAAIKLINKLNGKLGDTEALTHAHDVMGHEYHCTYKTMVVELHAYAGWAGNRFRKKSFKKFCSRWLDYGSTATIGDTGAIPCPAPQFDVLYVFNHICQHLSNNGLGLRQFCDWAILLHRYHDKIDLAQLRRDLRRTGLYKAWQILGGIVVYQIGLPQNEFPFFNARRAKRSQGTFLDDLVNGANFVTGQRTHRQLPHGLRRAWLGLADLFTLARSANIISLPTAFAAFGENFMKRMRGTMKRVFKLAD